MNKIKDRMYIVAMTACIKRTTEATKMLHHRIIKGDKNDCFIFGSWFVLKRSAESTIYVSAENIDIV